jgi:methionyl-tRNA synthetase
MVKRMGSDLANDFGNLAQRVLSMINKNCEGRVPAPGSFSDADRTLLDAAGALLGNVRTEINQQTFHKALDAIWLVIGDGNRYVDSQAPWALKKTDPARMGTVLYVLAETVRHLAILCQPFMPQSCGRMLDQLGVPPGGRTFAALTMASALKPATTLPKPEPIFPRFQEAEGAA